MEQSEILDAIARLQVQLKTFDEQGQRAFNLRSKPARCGEVLGCPWCRRPLQVEVAPSEEGRPLDQQQPPPQRSRGRRDRCLRVQVGSEDLQAARTGCPPAVSSSQLAAREQRAPQGGDSGGMEEGATSPSRSPLERRLLIPRSRFAHCSVLYGEKKEYFLGAMMLGWSLLESRHDVVLLVTSDVPRSYRSALQLVYSHVVEVEYLKMNADPSQSGKYGPSSRLFKRPGRTRFADVFTKLQVFALTCYEKVLFLDLDTWVRDAGRLDDLFEKLPAPAALQRGENPGAVLGSAMPYEACWRGYKRKAWVEEDGKTFREHHRAFEQASGINAGVMLLRPSAPLLQFFKEDMSEWDHPGHFATYMPEQEYLGRMLASLDTAHIEECYAQAANADGSWTCERVDRGDGQWGSWSGGSWGGGSWGGGSWGGGSWGGDAQKKPPAGEALPTLHPGFRETARARL
eukprot:14758742-Alexandrium_andersonii.AAC.1